MSTVSLSGNDTVIINNRVFTDFSTGDVAHITFPNEIANVKTGKNGNSIYSFNATGKQCELKMKIIRGSGDDKYLNSILAQQQANFAGFTLMFGEFVKKLGDGSGNIASDTYEMGGGIFVKIPEAKSNQEGDTGQSEIEYSFKFSNAPRTIS
jgi:hypothetical protein